MPPQDAAPAADRALDAVPAPLARRASRLARFREAHERLVAEEAQRQAAHAALIEERAAFTADTGQRAPGRDPGPLRPRPGRSANPTDPDSRAIQGPHGWLQGYNAQAVVAEDGVIIAAELSQDPTDARLLEPMLRAARANLAAAGVTAPIGTLLADAGYWSEGNAALERADGPRFLISPTSGRPRAPGSRRPLGPGRVRMRARLADSSTRALYRRRATIVEPVFGQLKEIRGVRRLLRRRFSACASEWQLICATHNLLKLWRFGGSRPDGPPRSPVPRRSGGPGSATPRQWRRGRVRGRRFTS